VRRARSPHCAPTAQSPRFSAWVRWPGFVAVQDGLLCQRLLPFLARGVHRVARFFPRRLGTPQTDGNVPRAFHQGAAPGSSSRTPDPRPRDTDSVLWASIGWQLGDVRAPGLAGHVAPVRGDAARLLVDRVVCRPLTHDTARRSRGVVRSPGLVTTTFSQPHWRLPRVVPMAQLVVT
jgi:hypothetical protein